MRLRQRQTSIQTVSYYDFVVPANCGGVAGFDGDGGPNKDPEAGGAPKTSLTGVATREDEGAEAGVSGNKPAPDLGKAAGVCGAFEDPGVAELLINPVTCVLVLVATGRWRVGWTLLAAASCFAVSLRSASRNGSLHSPLRRWSARYAVLIDSMYW